MTLFNLKSNQTIHSITSQKLEISDSFIEDRNDSMHMYVPIKLSNIMINNESLLIKTLLKKEFSINALVVTSDNYIILIKRSTSHAYNHVEKNTIIITSISDLYKKLSILNNSLMHYEKLILNNKLRAKRSDEIFNTDSSKISLSFLDIMKLLELRFLPTYISNHASSYNLYTHNNTLWMNGYLPGGKIDKDDSISKALIREVFEETGIVVDEVNQDKIIYHNIFDKLCEKFYHNLIFVCKTSVSSSNVLKNFKRNYEVANIIIVDITSIPSVLQEIVKTQ